MTDIKKGGRPSRYSEKLAAEICELIREGKSERSIGKMEGFPGAATLRRWKDEHPEFCQRTAQARTESAAKYREMALEQAVKVSSLADKILQGQAVNEAGLILSDLPRGYVEAKKLIIQELNREASIRDDRNYGDRKRVALGGDEYAPPVKREITPMTAEELEAIQNLQIAERERKQA